jgi:hypothetical protein
VLAVERKPCAGGDALPLIMKVEEEGKKVSKEFRALPIETWRHVRPGALALDAFTVLPVPNLGDVHLRGITVVVPDSNGTAVVVSALYSYADEGRRWDVARLVAALD